jgi:SAM-dependent methyltransferase
MESFEQFVRSRLPEPPARVLEVGCGQGELTTALAVAGHDALGIDPVAPDGPLFRRLTLDGVDEHERFDAVVASHSLHHIRDLDAALAKVALLLGDGGVLLVDDVGWDLLDEPTLGWFWEQQRAIAAATGEDAPATPAELRERWEADRVGLHGDAALRRALEARFDEVAFERVPYLYRLLRGVSSAVLEQALIDAGAIRALGFRYAGSPRKR